MLFNCIHLFTHSRNLVSLLKRNLNVIFIIHMEAVRASIKCLWLYSDDKKKCNESLVELAYYCQPQVQHHLNSNSTALCYEKLSKGQRIVSRAIHWCTLNLGGEQITTDSMKGKTRVVCGKLLISINNFQMISLDNWGFSNTNFIKN